MACKIVIQYTLEVTITMCIIFHTNMTNYCLQVSSNEYQTRTRQIYH